MKNSGEHKKEAVKLYLEQIKVLTALASALFITPGVLTVLLNYRDGIKLSSVSKLMASIAVTASSIMFLVAIILTYFIYSSLVGRINVGEYDIERELTMKFSKCQFYLVAIGCLFYLCFVIILIHN